MKSELLIRILSSVVLIPIVILLIIGNSIVSNLFILLCFFIALYEWHKMSYKKIYYFFGVIFLAFSFITVYQLKNFNNELLLFFFVLLICISTDIGGYIFGKLFKGPKLISISPKKTYAGMVGSFIFAFVSTFFYLKLLYIFTDNVTFSKNTYFLTLLISSTSQIGDIIISYYKRLSKIKDTGKLIPGHGGLLDRIDGMIFAFPCTYIVTSFNLIVIL